MDIKKITELEDKILNDYSNIAGIVVSKDGRVNYEKYFNNCTPQSRIHVYSVTKSILSLLIGIAMDKGYIKDVNQKILDFFPEYNVTKNEAVIQNITLKNLLTMTAPYKYRDNVPYTEYFTSSDWVKFSLDQLGGREQIGTFRYTPLIGPDILSGILVKATGASVFDFASEHLFSPLDITVERPIVFHSKEEQFAFNESTTISGWVADQAGVNAGGWGLTLSPVDMAKIGQLYLNDGIWEEKQIVSAKWMDESMSEHSFWDEQGLSYGYLWWIVDTQEKACAAMGDGGNVIYFNKKKNLVISIASLFAPYVSDRIELIKNFIEPLFLRES